MKGHEIKHELAKCDLKMWFKSCDYYWKDVVEQMVNDYISYHYHCLDNFLKVLFFWGIAALLNIEENIVELS